eukprot:TRINITY_DN2943_c0_g1_i8.p1 TRINITY_DN2943_c0_g1~~TRINITY_DN2943_c0_g1_i8.p1  ORF type:complete len:1347 (-),score=364.38 TRINITY_DN2943_c0_g1_i8:96-3785(-)
MERNGFREEVYETWAYSPFLQEDGTVGGVITPVVEVTSKVIGERRLRLLRELGTTKTETYETVFLSSMEVLKSDAADVPFAMYYHYDRNKKSFFLKALTNELTPQQAPEEITYGDQSMWPLTTSLDQAEEIVFSVKDAKFGSLPNGPWSVDDRVHLAACVPIPIDDLAPDIFLIVGLNPLRPYDDAFRGFVQLLVRNLGSSFATAKSLEEEKQKRKALAEIDQAKTLFFSNVSHEFRTPLTLILGPLTEVLDDRLTPVQKSHRAKLKLVRRNSRRLLKLVNTLLDFSRIEAGRSQAQFEPVDLCALTEDLSSVFRAAIEKANMYLLVTSSAIGEPVYVDKNMWEKIILNLLSNAFKFTLKGGITVHIQRGENNFAQVSIKDTGIGVSQAELPRLFERFHRIESAKGRSYEGSGIGLALTFELVKLHGGFIVANSQLGHGTEFVIKIPLGTDHLPASQIIEPEEETDGWGSGEEIPPSTPSLVGTSFAEEAMGWLPDTPQNFSSPSMSDNSDETLTPTEEGMHTTAKRVILLVDDNIDMREYVSGLLRRYYTVITACDGVEGLAVLKEIRPDLILSDVMMPNMDGFEFLQHVKFNLKITSVPFILLSARSGEEAKVEGLQAGADDYLVKPFSAKELLAKIQTHIELGRARFNLESQVEDKTFQLLKINKTLEAEIAERRQASILLAASEAKYRALARAAPVGILQTDNQGKVIFANTKWTNMTGLSEENTKAGKWLEVIHPEDVIQVETIWQTRHNSVLEHRLKNIITGETLWVILNTEILWKTDGNFDGLLATITDITHVKQLEREKFEAVSKAEMEHKRRAEEAEDHKKRQEMFVDVICHEIRNPLNGIYNNVDLLRMSMLRRQKVIQNPELVDWNEERSQLHLDLDALDAIAMCSQNQKVITDDVLDLSKLEANKYTLNPTEFRAKETIESVVQMIDSDARKKGIHVTTHFENFENSTLIGDRDRLTQVIINLLSNAIKFTEKSLHQKEVSIKVSKIQEDSKTFLQVSVSDTGVGMTEYEQSIIFNRFAQANQKTHQEYGGSGLGLFICKKLVELLGGKIFVTSQKGIGTDFTFTMYIEHATKELAPQKEIDIKNLMAHLSLTRHVILIVEDNSVNQKVLKRHLENVNCQCDIAENGAIAVDFIQRKQYHGVLMDIEMPIMDGIEATRKVRTWEKSLGKNPVPIIGLSGNARQEHVNLALDTGMTDYIFKPYDKGVLYQKIDLHFKS